MNELIFRRPDDMHCHLRQDDSLATTVPHTASQFARAIVMPNLIPPVTEVSHAIAYQQEILQQCSTQHTFEPLMTLYLTPTLSADTLEEAAACPAIHGIKLYPQGATTHSDQGIVECRSIYPQLEIMQDRDIPLLLHGEVTHPEVDIFARERHFLEEVLQPIIQNFPKLRIVLEHISTHAAVEFVTAQSEQVAATITPQHLWLTRNDLLVGGIKPHNYCLPVAKTSSDQSALIQAAISGNPKFFLGTDSAPHERSAKEAPCGCAGIYTAPVAMNLYAEIFTKHGALTKLPAFASEFGARFYRLPLNQQEVRLYQQKMTVPDSYPFGHAEVIPFQAGQTLHWQFAEIS